MPRPGEFVLDTLTGPSTLDDIQDTLTRAWAAYPEVPGNIRMQLSIAAAEIGANIIEHAGGGKPIRMRMQVRPMPTEVHISFTNDGSFVAQVDLSNLGEAEEMAERGRGLPLVQNVLSQLGYRRDTIGNHWTLISKQFHTRGTGGE